jgi:hypothetical protein
VPVERYSPGTESETVEDYLTQNNLLTTHLFSPPTYNISCCFTFIANTVSRCATFKSVLFPLYIPSFF